MQIHQHLDNIPSIPRSIVTQGTFDGVHQAHQTIIKRIVELANENSSASVLITYHPHPRHVLYPEQNDLKLLSTIDEKINRLSLSGIDHLIIVPFTHSFSQLSSTDFIRDFIIGKLQAETLVLGYDHRFGKNREGSFEKLLEMSRELPLELEKIPQQLVDSIAVSSTKIRVALSQGDIHTANNLLGYPYLLISKVLHGDKRGRTIGFPTANLIPSPQKQLPADGVYAVKVQSDWGNFDAVCNIGTRPTVDGKNHVVEVHIPDISVDLYDQNIRVYFYHRLRDEMKMDGLESLKKQLMNDVNDAKNYFKSINSAIVS